MKKKKAARLKARLRDLQHQNDELLEDIKQLVGLGDVGSEYNARERWIARFSIRSRVENAMWSGSPIKEDQTTGFKGLGKAINESVWGQPTPSKRYAEFLSKQKDIQVEVKPIGTNGGIKRTGLIH